MQLSITVLVVVGGWLSTGLVFEAIDGAAASQLSITVLVVVVGRLSTGLFEVSRFKR